MTSSRLGSVPSHGLRETAAALSQPERAGARLIPASRTWDARSRAEDEMCGVPALLRRVGGAGMRCEPGFPGDTKIGLPGGRHRRCWCDVASDSTVAARCYDHYIRECRWIVVHSAVSGGGSESACGVAAVAVGDSGIVGRASVAAGTCVAHAPVAGGGVFAVVGVSVA
jgi:hypothetical protein